MPIRRTNMDNMIETINSYAKKDGLKISSNVITAIKEVYAIEIIKELAEKTREVLQDYKNIKTGIRNGYDGWEKYAPYDRIMVAAKTNQVPNKLFNQLVNNGKMIIPLIEESKEKLVLITKGDYNSFVKETLIGVRFVPLVGG